MITVNVRGSILVLSSMRSRPLALPLPEVGDTMAQVTSVRAVQAQPAPVVTAKSYEPPLESTDRGRPSAARPHPAGDGDGDGVGLGDALGLGDGPVGVADPVDPHPATAIASTHGAQRSSTRMMVGATAESAPIGPPPVVDAP
jgi:hypothetical protein